MYNTNITYLAYHMNNTLNIDTAFFKYIAYQKFSIYYKY